MEAASELKRLFACILRDELKGELHRDGDGHFKVKVVRPEGTGIIIGAYAEGDFRHLFGIFGTTDAKQQDSRKAVWGHIGQSEGAKLWPADGNAAMYLVRTIVVVIGVIKRLGVPCGTIGEGVRTEEGDFGDSVAIREHGDGVSLVSHTKNDASGGSVACVEFF